MRRVAITVALCATLGIGAVSYTVAQDTPATPGSTPELCGSPGASPATPGMATPVQTSGDPAAVATSVVTNVQGGLDQVTCGTPAS